MAKLTRPERSRVVETGREWQSGSEWHCVAACCSEEQRVAKLVQSGNEWEEWQRVAQSGKEWQRVAASGNTAVKAQNGVEW